MSDSPSQVASSDGPTLLILYGLPGCGKLTTATALASLLPSFKLFHNHLVVDTLLKLFPFGTPSFKKFREQIWMDVIPEAGRNGDSLIFTFAPEETVSAGFLDRLKEAFEQATASTKGKVLFVRLQCDVATVRERLTAASRGDFQKLTCLDIFNNAHAAGFFAVQVPAADLVIDVTNTPAVESATKIRDFVLA